MSEDKNVNKKGFWKGMKSELKKVIWPTGKQTVKSTFATIAFVVMVSLVLIVFNYVFNALSNLWIRSLSHEDVIENVVISSGDTAVLEESGEVSGEDEDSGLIEEMNENVENVDDASAITESIAEDNETIVEQAE